MSGDVSNLRTRLEELADSPAPPSTFDPARTAAAGRRRVLARRTTAVGGGGALAVAAVAGIVAAFGPATPARITPVGPASGIGADPLASFVSFGWLPDSLPYVSYMATSDGKGNDVIAQGPKAPDGAPRVDLQLLPRSPGDESGPGTPTAEQRFIPVKLTDGRQAYWVTQARTQGTFAGVVQLRFPAKDGRWISLTWGVNWGRYGDEYTIAGVPAPPSPTATTPGALVPAPTSVPLSPAWQQSLLRMATEVTDTPRQIPMPLRVAGLPPNFQPTQTVLFRPGGFGEQAPGTWNALLVFTSENNQVSIEVGPRGSLAGDVAGAPKGTRCAPRSGLDVCVEKAGDMPVFDELGGAEGMLKMITVLGTDEKDWTTDVLVP